LWKTIRSPVTGFTMVSPGLITSTSSFSSLTLEKVAGRAPKIVGRGDGLGSARRPIYISA
jgi:hypothetical protein